MNDRRAGERIARRIRGWRIARAPRLRVAIVGGERVTDLVARGYLSDRRAVLSGVHAPERERAEAWAAAWGGIAPTTSMDRLLSDPAVDAVEIAAPLDRRAETAIAALRAGKHVSVLKPIARTLDEAESVVDAARNAKRFLRVNDPLVFYPPYRKAKELLESLEIGELATIRMKSNLAGNGGWGPDFDAQRMRGTEQLFHPCFDKFALAAWLFGAPAEVMAYLNDMDPACGGASVILWKGQEAGRYGIIENVYSPDMRIRSDYYPCDETIEITGTDGILWITRCTGRMVEAPPIVVRKGRTHYQIGVESGLATDWAEAFSGSARHFVTSVLAGRAPRLSAEEGKAALRFLLTAAESAGSRTPLSLVEAESPCV